MDGGTVPGPIGPRASLSPTRSASPRGRDIDSDLFSLIARPSLRQGRGPGNAPDAERATLLLRAESSAAQTYGTLGGVRAQCQTEIVKLYIPVTVSTDSCSSSVFSCVVTPRDAMVLRDCAQRRGRAAARGPRILRGDRPHGVRAGRARRPSGRRSILRVCATSVPRRGAIAPTSAMFERARATAGRRS
jgi:hypothetical protein